MKKTAYGPQDAARVLRLAKAKQLPKASAKVGRDLVPSTFQASKTSRLGKAVRGGAGPGTGLSIIPNEKTYQRLHRLKPEDTAELKKFTRGKDIVLPGEGSFHKQLKRSAGKYKGKLPKLDGQNKKMLESIVKGHELDEIQAARKAGRMGKGMSPVTKAQGHVSPDILFREHNRVSTLPKGYEGARDTMRGLRKSRREDTHFKRFGMEYGSGPRLSRHARKRMTEALETRHAREVEALKRWNSHHGEAEEMKNFKNTWNDTPATPSTIPAQKGSVMQRIKDRFTKKKG